jgi:hypothetical protein
MGFWQACQVLAWSSKRRSEGLIRSTTIATYRPANEAPIRAWAVTGGRSHDYDSVHSRYKELI